MKNDLITGLKLVEKEWKRQDDHVKELKEFKNNLIANLDSDLDWFNEILVDVRLLAKNYIVLKEW